MKGICVVVITSVSLLSSSAFAETCGLFTDIKSDSKVLFSNDGTAREYSKDGEQIAFYYHYRQGQTVGIRNGENGLADIYRISEGGKRIKTVQGAWGGRELVSKKPYRCVSVQALKFVGKQNCESGKEHECCASGDIDACIQDAAGKKDLAGLGHYCATSPYACVELIDNYKKAADTDEISFDVYAAKKPLPIGQLNDLVAMCEKHKTPRLCQSALDQLWLGRQFVMSRKLLGVMCTSKLMDRACERFTQLNSVKLPEKTLESATSLPCGEYASTVASLTGDVTFRDRGIVELGVGSTRRARLEDGLVKIRHDKGGDFILARVGEDTLLGVDDWNRLEVYKRKVAPDKACLAPVVCREQPLSSACGLDKDPKECCEAGDTQGCNRLGSMAALGNNWKEAAELYAKVCSKGVRVGCENWIFTVSKTGDDQGVEKGLAQLCQNDGRHVACDLLELNTLPQMMMRFTMEQVLKDADNSRKQK